MPWVSGVSMSTATHTPYGSARMAAMVCVTHARNHSTGGSSTSTSGSGAHPDAATSRARPRSQSTVPNRFVAPRCRCEGW